MSDAAGQAVEMHEFTASARLVYLALRQDESGLTADEVVDKAGLSDPTVRRSLEELMRAGWAVEQTRETDGVGRYPSEYKPMVACKECGERYIGMNGVRCHDANEHAVGYRELEDMDPEDVFGDQADKPEPKRGLQ